MSSDITRPGLERPATRPEFSRQLLVPVDRLEARLGDVSLATEIQLLKRELARGHAVLTRPEDNYLSVVCLVEAALASLTWKLYTPVVLAALRRHFRESDVPVGPTIALDPPDAEAEGEDGPQA